MTDNQVRIPLQKLPEDDSGREAFDRSTDYTADNAPRRSFYINLKILKFGTPDIIQGAAITLSIFLLIAIMVLGVLVTILPNRAGHGMDILSYLLAAAIGVAIGRNIPPNS